MPDDTFFEWVKECRDEEERWSDIAAKASTLLKQAKAAETADRQMRAEAEKAFPLGESVKIYLRFWWPQTNATQRKSVKGNVVVVPGYEEFRFVVHPELRFRGSERIVDETRFYMSEATSGLRLGPNPAAPTPHLAAYLVAEKMKRRHMTPDKMRDRVRTCLTNDQQGEKEPDDA